MPPPRVTAPTINGTIGMPPVVGRSIITYTRMPRVEAPRIPPVRTDLPTVSACLRTMRSRTLQAVTVALTFSEEADRCSVCPPPSL